MHVVVVLFEVVVEAGFLSACVTAVVAFVWFFADTESGMGRIVWMSLIFAPEVRCPEISLPQNRVALNSYHIKFSSPFIFPIKIASPKIMSLKILIKLSIIAV